LAADVDLTTRKKIRAVGHQTVLGILDKNRSSPLITRDAITPHAL
jgi:hypothetical protein